MVNRYLLDPPNVHEELTAISFPAIQSLPPTRKASLLLNTPLSLIAAGQCVFIFPAVSFLALLNLGSISRCGAEVENLLEVYLRPPNLDKGDVACVLVARGNAMNAAGDRLLGQAQEGT